MPSRSRPSIWSTVWIRREYISIWRRPMTRTEPGSQTRLLSLRSTSEHMVSSDSSFFELSSLRICSRVGDRVVAALDRAGDRAGLDAAAVDPHEHLRRGADQIFALAEIDEEGIGRRVDRLQPPARSPTAASRSARRTSGPAPPRTGRRAGSSPWPCRPAAHIRRARGRRAAGCGRTAGTARRRCRAAGPRSKTRRRNSRSGRSRPWPNSGRRPGSRRAGRARGRAGSSVRSSR